MDTLFFLASKLFWAPWRVRKAGLSFCLLLRFLGFRRSGERRGMAMLVSSLAFVLLVGIVPVGDALLRPLEMRFSSEPSTRHSCGDHHPGWGRGCSSHRGDRAARSE